MVVMRALSLGCLSLVSLLIGVTPVGAAPAAQQQARLFSVISDVGSRQALIERRMNEAVVAGRLTQIQLDQFKQRLDMIANQEAEFKASQGTLNLWESLKLQFELDDIIKDLERSFTDRKFGTVDLPARKQEIERRLDIALKARRITAEQSNDLRKELNGIYKQEDAYRKADKGQLSVINSFKIVIELDHFSAELTKSVRSRQIDLQIAIDEKNALLKDVQADVDAQKLTVDQGKNLQTILEQIGSRIDKLNKTKRSLTSEEQLTLLKDLQAVADQVSSRSGQTETLAGQFALLEQAISTGLASLGKALDSGLISKVETSKFNDGLVALDTKRKEAVSPLSKNAPDMPFVKAMVVEATKLTDAINRAKYSKDNDWPGIKGTLDTLDKRISDAKNSKRMAEADAKSLSDELGKVVSERKANLKQDGSIIAGDALKLLNDIEALTIKVEKAIIDRIDITGLDVKAKLQNVQKRLSAAMATGKLKADKAKGFNDDLVAIQNRSSLLKPGASNFERETYSMAILLEKIDTDLAHELNIAGSTPVNNMATFKKLDDAIRDATLSGNLAPVKVGELKDELERLRNLQRDATKTADVADGLSKLNDDLDDLLKNKESALPDIGKRQAELFQSITEGVLQGRISPKDGDMLKRDFYAVMEQETKYTTSGGLSFGEHAAVVLQLEKLARKIESTMSAGPQAVPDPTARRQELDNKLAQAVISGTLTSDKARDFSKQLEKVARDEVTYRFSGEGLSYSESLTLIADMERINSALDTAIAGQKPRWANLDERYKALEQKINRSVASNKIDKGRGDKLKADLQSLARTRRDFETSGGGISLAEAESLVREFVRINGNIDVKP